MCPEVCTPNQFAELTGMNPNVVRRLCEEGRLPAGKVGNRWFINSDRALGKAAPVRTQPVDVDELSDRIASRLRQASEIGSAGTLPTTRFYHR